MPFYEGKFFKTDEDLLKYLREKPLVEPPPSLRLYDKIEDYLREIKVTADEKKLSWLGSAKASLFNKMSTFFVDMWENVWLTLRRALSGIISDLFTLFWKEAVEKHTPGIKDYFRKRIAVVELPDTVKKELTERLEDETPLGHFALFLFNILVTGGKFLSILTAVHDVGRQEGYAELQPSLPGVADIMMAKFRDPKYEPVIDDYMKRMGFNVTVRDMLKLVSWTLLNPEQIRQLFLRGEIDKSDKDKRLRSLGIKEEDIDKIEKLYYFIPSPTDLVRMAVREAFYPEYIRKYGLMEEYPAEFEEWAKKQGMSKFWSEKFWASHWFLPSIGQGYEMLHRGVISKTDLDSLFRAVDIMPYWRDKLLAISFSPYTRIDIRRMYRTGVVDNKEVYKTYLALGYDDEHAKNLTAFTVKDAMESERDLSKADVIGAYQRKIIDRSRAKSLITSLKYSTDEAEIYLKRSDLDTLKKLKEKQLSWIKRNYVIENITHEEARNRLSKIDLKGAEVNELFTDWDIEREGRMAELTFKQLQTLLMKKIISEDVFKGELRKKKYTDEHIGWLVELTHKGVVEGE